jgi:hypothetical protein
MANTGARRVVMRLIVMPALLFAALIIAAVAWSGYRVTSAMNHGALKSAIVMCMDQRHLLQREENRVPQKVMDHVLILQIWFHHARMRGRKLPDSILLKSSRIGWQTFWSDEERQQLYTGIEPRMRPCPNAIDLYRKLQAAKRNQA